MIDLHAHILPGVDDGVKTEDEAVEFARMAVADGTRTLVATPHSKDGFFENGRERVLEGVQRLRARLSEEAIPLDLVPGAEVYLAPDLVQRVRDGRAPTLADNGRTLLLELSTHQYPVDLENIVFQLRLAGIQVLFAHPERIRYFHDEPRRWEEVVRLGAFGQITTGSILGVFGTEIGEFSEDLTRRRLVHVVASDAHNVRGRPPRLRQALATVAAWIGEAEAMRMVTEVPRAFLDGLDPDVPPPKESRVRRSFLSRMFGRV